MKARHYVLVHNRTDKSAELRESVEEELCTLVESDQVELAELWDRQRLLREAFNAMLRRVRGNIRRQNVSAAKLRLDRECERFVPIEAVPLRISKLVADQNRLRSVSSGKVVVADPALEIMRSKGRTLSLLIGEFGVGKTTAVMRALAASDLQILFVQGAAISKKTVGVKDLLYQCIDTEVLMEEFEPEDREVLSLLLRPTIEYVLKDPDLPVVLVLDGIDESGFLNHRGALQQLFNILDWVRPPVILTMRTEFWNSRRAEFEAVSGKVAGHGEKRNKEIWLTELRPWSDKQIGELVRRYCAGQQDADGQARVASLEGLLETDRFESLYGDIPRRPLFLRMILDSVAKEGLPGESVGRAMLFSRWVQMKISRDICEPIRKGGEGRAAIEIESESFETTVALAWRAMLAAAAEMTVLEDGVVELVSECVLDKVLDAAPELRRIREPSGLFLNSLLLPVSEHRGIEPLRIRFAHRAFQEFFLAWFLLEHPDTFRNRELPSGVREWQEDLVREGVVGFLGSARGSSLGTA